MFTTETKKNFIFITVTLVVAIFIIYLLNKYLEFSDSASETATQIYFVDNISDAHALLIEKFNRENTGEIEVVPVDLPFEKFSTNERKELLARSLRSKNEGIDVFAVDLIWVPRFTRWGEPLDLYFPVNEREQILEPALESCYYDEKFVSAPFYIDIGLMYYRKDLLKKLSNDRQIQNKINLGLTWEELITIKQDNAQIKNPLYLFAGKNFEGLVCSFIEGVLADDPAAFAQKEVNLNTSGAKKSLQLLVDLIYKYHITPEAVVKYNEVNVYLSALKNDALFFRGWPGLFLQENPPEESYKLEFIDIAPLPHFKGKKARSVYGGWNLMVSKFSRKKHESIKFVKFLLNEENQKILYENGGYIPVNKKVYKDTLFMHRNAILKKYRYLMKQGVHRPFRVDYTRISDILSYYINLALKNEISVEQALRNATEKINSSELMVY